jgi:hypothetical protein
MTARGATGVRSSVPSTQVVNQARSNGPHRASWLEMHLVTMQTPASYASMPGPANSLFMMHAGAATTVTGSAGFPMPVRGTAKPHELQLEP